MTDSNTTLPTVTAKESAMLKVIRENEYTSDSRYGGCWAFTACPDRSGSSVFGSLVKKGLADASGKGDDRWLALTDLGAYVLDDLLMMEGEGPVLDAPIDISAAAREDDFAPVLVEEADSSKVTLDEVCETVFETLFSEAGSFIGKADDAAETLEDGDKVYQTPRDCELDCLGLEEEDDGFAAEYVAAQSRKNAGTDGRAQRVLDNRSGANGREAQDWQLTKDRKAAEEAARVAPGVESCGCGSPRCFVVGEELGSRDAEADAPGLDLCRDCGLVHEEPSKLVRATEALEVALAALQALEDAVEAADAVVADAEAALKVARAEDMEDDHCGHCDGSGMVEVQDCGPSSTSCTCGGFSGGCTSWERCPCDGVRCRVDEDTGEGGDDCPCFECIGNRFGIGGL